MNIRFPLYVKEDIISYMGSEIRRTQLMVPNKFLIEFELFDNLGKFTWSMDPIEIHSMNSYIRKMKDTGKLHKIDDSSIRYELEELIGFFSKKQENQEDIIKNLNDLLLLTNSYN